MSYDIMFELKREILTLHKLKLLTSQSLFF